MCGRRQTDRIIKFPALKSNPIETQKKKKGQINTKLRYGTNHSFGVSQQTQSLWQNKIKSKSKIQISSTPPPDPPLVCSSRRVVLLFLPFLMNAIKNFCSSLELNIMPKSYSIYLTLGKSYKHFEYIDSRCKEDFVDFFFNDY